MPWHVEQGNPDCAGWAVVKDDTGEVVGCHESQEGAEDQLTALNIAEYGDEDRAVEDVDLTPTAEMRDLAARGLEFHDAGRSGDGLAPETVSDARAIAAGEQLTPDKVVRMNAWFARHLPDLDAPANSDPEDEDYPGPGAVAWLLWAGDPTDPEAAGVAWSARKVAELEREGYGEDRNGEVEDLLAPRQRALYEKYEGIAEVFGPWTKDAGPDGAHYIGPADNVFNEEGLNCAACVFFRGGGACEIVEGEIDPEAVCKLWIIPAGISGNDETYDDDVNDVPDMTPEAEVEAERSILRGGVEWRESGAGKQYRTIRGYAAIWGARSEDLGGFVEVLERGAFSAALADNPDVALLYNHDDATIMARTTAGTLELEEDERGLRVWARVDMGDPDVARVVGKMNAGNVSQMSFRFSMNPEGDDWTTTEGGTPLRVIRAGGIKRLWEASLVPFPAYPATKASVFERAIESGRLPSEGAAAPAAPDDPADGASEPRADRSGDDRRAEAARLRASLWAARLSKHRTKESA